MASSKPTPPISESVPEVTLNSMRMYAYGTPMLIWKTGERQPKGIWQVSSDEAQLELKISVTRSGTYHTSLVLSNKVNPHLVIPLTIVVDDPSTQWITLRRHLMIPDGDMLTHFEFLMETKSLAKMYIVTRKSPDLSSSVSFSQNSELQHDSPAPTPTPAPTPASPNTETRASSTACEPTAVPVSAQDIIPYDQGIGTRISSRFRPIICSAGYIEGDNEQPVNQGGIVTTPPGALIQFSLKVLTVGGKKFHMSTSCPALHINDNQTVTGKTGTDTSTFSQCSLIPHDSAEGSYQTTISISAGIDRDSIQFWLAIKPDMSMNDISPPTPSVAPAPAVAPVPPVAPAPPVNPMPNRDSSLSMVSSHHSVRSATSSAPGAPQPSKEPCTAISNETPPTCAPTTTLPAARQTDSENLTIASNASSPAPRYRVAILTVTYIRERKHHRLEEGACVMVYPGDLIELNVTVLTRVGKTYRMTTAVPGLKIEQMKQIPVKKEVDTSTFKQYCRVPTDSAEGTYEGQITITTGLNCAPFKFWMTLRLRESEISGDADVNNPAIDTADKRPALKDDSLRASSQASIAAPDRDLFCSNATSSTIGEDHPLIREIWLSSDKEVYLSITEGSVESVPAGVELEFVCELLSKSFPLSVVIGCEKLKYSKRSTATGKEARIYTRYEQIVVLPESTPAGAYLFNLSVMEPFGRSKQMPFTLKVDK